MYVLHAYKTLELYIFNASIVSTDSKLACSNSQSCLWLEKTTFFDLALHVGLACRLEPPGSVLCSCDLNVGAL